MIYMFFFLMCVFLDNHGQTLMLDVKSQDIVGNHGQSLHVIFGYTVRFKVFNFKLQELNPKNWT
jgi:hypothetical protein